MSLLLLFPTGTPSPPAPTHLAGITIDAQFSTQALITQFASPQLTATFTSPTIVAEFSNPSIQVTSI